MNLFVTSSDPKQCARDLDDRRLIKSILETAMLLSTALRHHGFNHRALYRTTHQHHPVSKWVMKKRGNYAWALAYFKAACREYSKRFFQRTHKSERMTPYFLKGQKTIPPGERRAFQNSASNRSLGLDFTHLPPIKAYKAYLAAKWDREEPRWSRVAPPDWYKRRSP
jgi:hypothetical protein